MIRLCWIGLFCTVFHNNIIIRNNHHLYNVDAFTIQKVSSLTTTTRIRRSNNKIQDHTCSLLLSLQSSTKETSSTINDKNTDEMKQQSSDITSTATSLLPRILDNFNTLCHQGSDIRGSFIETTTPNDDMDWESIRSALQGADGSQQTSSATVPALTPFASYCIGYAFIQQQLDNNSNNDTRKNEVTIAIGYDSRIHGPKLAQAFMDGATRGAKEYNTKSSSSSTTDVVTTVHIKNCNVVTTPACAAFCKMHHTDAAVMITASHLPADRNGFKLFAGTNGAGYTKPLLHNIYERSAEFVTKLYNNKNYQVNFETNNGITVSNGDVSDWMSKYYAQSLKEAILSKTTDDETTKEQNKPLDGLKIVLNAGNGAGGFFANVLEVLGATCVGCSLHLKPDGTFPAGYIPNPESSKMVKDTIQQCQTVQADLGIMLDTDADRCGFVVPTSDDNTIFEPLNRNRLIALLSVIFATESPGCAIVTDSVTSEGLAKFLTTNLKLQHIRYIKGYANVINKAKEVTQSGQADVKMAIETSGHCAMQENGYLDDGTYTAVQIVSLLARNQNSCVLDSSLQCKSLLDLIADMEELPIFTELRITTIDQSLATMNCIFDVLLDGIEHMATTYMVQDWEVDTENLEGIRVRVHNNSNNDSNESGQFFMVRKSLHDPIISIQIEAWNEVVARTKIIQPLLQFMDNHIAIQNQLDTSVLSKFINNN